MVEGGYAKHPHYVGQDSDEYASERYWIKEGEEGGQMDKDVWQAAEPLDPPNLERRIFISFGRGGDPLEDRKRHVSWRHPMRGRFLGESSRICQLNRLLQTYLT